MRRGFFILLVLFFSLSACTAARQPSPRSVHTKKAPEKAASRQDASKEGVELLVKRGDFGAAVEMIRREVKAGGSELSFGDPYVASTNGLAEEGMKHFSGQDFGAAGAAFRKALDNYPQEASLQGRVKYPARKLEDSLNECSRKLMDEGLVLYRNGDLTGAIATWKKILAFDPANQEASKAVETATVQLKRLKSLE